MVNKSKAMRFTTTTVAPAGVENRKRKYQTNKETNHCHNGRGNDHAFESFAYPHRCQAGKIIKLEISRAPINRIPITMVMAVKNAKMILYRPTFFRLPLQNFSSNVTAKILL